MEAHRSISARTGSERALTATRPPASTSLAFLDTSARATSLERKAIPRRPIRTARLTRKGIPEKPEAVASMTIFDCIGVPERRL
jgi:hypothetical protein